jgi:putative colanic acid biosynthesis acetyltransferase WcaF
MKPTELTTGSHPAADPQPRSPIAPAGSTDQQAWVDLGAFRNDEYSPGRGPLQRTAWYITSLIVFESGWFPIIRFKAWMLRCFGARIGTGLVVKPQVHIKYPWRLTVGDHCWIGQGAWIDNLADVRLGDHVCISQGAYLCTGSHDHRRRSFDLITAPIAVGSGAWIGAKAIVLPGCDLAANCVVAAGAVVRQPVGQAEIVAGNPARLVSRRTAPNP